MEKKEGSFASAPLLSLFVFSGEGDRMKEAGDTVDTVQVTHALLGTKRAGKHRWSRTGQKSVPPQSQEGSKVSEGRSWVGIHGSRTRAAVSLRKLGLLMGDGDIGEVGGLAFSELAWGGMQRRVTGSWGGN